MDMQLNITHREDLDTVVHISYDTDKDKFIVFSLEDSDHIIRFTLTPKQLRETGVYKVDALYHKKPIHHYDSEYINGIIKTTYKQSTNKVKIEYAIKEPASDTEVSIGEFTITTNGVLLK